MVTSLHRNRCRNATAHYKTPRGQLFVKFGQYFDQQSDSIGRVLHHRCGRSRGDDLAVLLQHYSQIAQVNIVRVAGTATDYIAC